MLMNYLNSDEDMQKITIWGFFLTSSQVMMKIRKKSLSTNNSNMDTIIFLDLNLHELRSIIQDALFFEFEEFYMYWSTNLHSSKTFCDRIFKSNIEFSAQKDKLTACCLTRWKISFLDCFGWAHKYCQSSTVNCQWSTVNKCINTDEMDVQFSLWLIFECYATRLFTISILYTLAVFCIFKHILRFLALNFGLHKILSLESQMLLKKHAQEINQIRSSNYVQGFEWIVTSFLRSILIWNVI